MKFFWPIRHEAELAETVEDPYDEKSRVQPKRKRRKLLSSSSDDSDDSNGGKCKRFGVDLDSDESESSESSDDDKDDEQQAKIPKIQEITTIDPNDEEDDEFEVSFCRKSTIDHSKSFFSDQFLFFFPCKSLDRHPRSLKW